MSGCDQAVVHTVSYVLIGFSKDTVVHKFEEVLFEVILGSSSQFRVQINILVHP